MKKVTVLCLDADRDRTIDRLQAAGVLHLTPVTPPAGDDLTARRSDLDSARKAVALLDAGPAAPGSGKATPAAFDAAAIVGEVIALDARRRELSETVTELQRERSAAEPFGDFDPAALRRLADAGIPIAFFRSRQPNLAPPTGAAAWTRLGTDRFGTLYAAAAATDVPSGAVAVEPPARPLSVVDRELRAAQAAADDLGPQMARLFAARAALAAYTRRLEDEVACIEARAGMGRAGRIAYLHGFCPADLVASLDAEARNNGWGLHTADPDPAERVPVLIRSPAWARPIDCLLRFIKILPGYHEADVSGSFLVFLSIFFAMIIGDAGYGAVFLVLTALVRRKMPRAPSEPFVLMTIFSVCTIAWGVATGVYFGVTALPAPLRTLRIDWLSDTPNIMYLCLLLGAVHLSVAHVWNAVRMINSPQAIAQVGWLTIVWGMYFAGRMLLLNQPFPLWYAPVMAVGLLAVIAFMTPRAKLKTEWINHAMLPLTLMSNFGDILSYLRLFALGVASVQLASAFNKIAVESIGFHGPFIGIVAAAVLFVGHTVNIVLSAMSVLVHGIRLNALEFSMHMGLEWSGTQYVPFSRRRSEPAG